MFYIPSPLDATVILVAIAFIIVDVIKFFYILNENSSMKFFNRYKLKANREAFRFPLSHF